MAERRQKIGLTMRVVETQGYFEPRDAVAQDWPRFLRAALPRADWMFLPNLGADHSLTYCERWGVNALILTGGEDIGTSTLRDETERALLAWARDRDLPVIGICRGMQMMAELAGTGHRPVTGHIRERHMLTGEIARKVNSYHKSGLSGCPEGYVVTGRAPDGEIEAIRHQTAQWEGWMWHPEREEPFDEADIRRMREILT